MLKTRAERAAILTSILTPSERARFEKAGLSLKQTDRVGGVRNDETERKTSQTLDSEDQEYSNHQNSNRETRRVNFFDNLENNEDVIEHDTRHSKVEKKHFTDTSLDHSRKKGRYSTTGPLEIDKLLANSASSKSIGSEHPAVVARLIRNLPIAKRGDVLRSFSGRKARDVIRFLKIGTK